MKSEYKKHPCIYCGATTMRAKLKGDWKRGEYSEKDYFPLYFNYWICDSCGKSAQSARAARITQYVTLIPTAITLLQWIK